MILRLAFGSLLARALTVAMTVLAIALSVMLFLGVEKARTGAKASFADTISGTDLIVGARSGSVQLLLYSVFRIGNATNNLTWESYQDIAARDDVYWIVPISLGDSHRQFRVMGTTTDFFARYKYRSGQSLAVQDGAIMADLFDAVTGLYEPTGAATNTDRGGIDRADDLTVGACCGRGRRCAALLARLGAQRGVRLRRVFGPGVARIAPAHVLAHISIG